MNGFTLTDQTVVELYPLHIGEEDQGEQEVGRPDTGVFISLPPEGTYLLRLLQSQIALGEVKKKFAEQYGQEPDLEDFLEGIASCNFVHLIDGQPADTAENGDVTVAPPRGWFLFANLPAERVLWLRSRPMQIVYLALWLGVPTLLLFDPPLLPSPSKALVTSSIIANALILTVLGWGIIALHELAHLFAARSYNCISSLNISHRLHLLVAQTDMTAVRTLPRNQRYGPYLAGMTCDMGILLLCLVLQLIAIASPLPAAIAYLTAIGIISQFAFFLRTDIYYVFANIFHLGNLMQDTQHWLINLAHRIIGRPGPYDQSAIPRRELTIIRWYAIFYLIGVVVLLGEFVLLGLPLLLEFLRQAVADLSIGPTHITFWDGAGFIFIVLLNFGLLFFVMWRDHVANRRAIPRPAMSNEATLIRE